MAHPTMKSAVLCALLLGACSNQGEQRQTPRREEMRTHVNQMQQEREQNRAERETSREQRQAAEARENVAEQRQDLAENRGSESAREDVTEARQELREQSQDLARAATKACAGLPVGEQQACPVPARSVASVEDIRNGVKVHLASNAGDAEAVERRITCHNAQRELATDQAASAGRPVSTQTTCFLDVAGVDTDVDDENGRVSVSVTTRNDENRERVRTLAREGAHAAPPLRTTGGGVRNR